MLVKPFILLASLAVSAVAAPVEAVEEAPVKKLEARCMYGDHGTCIQAEGHACIWRCPRNRRHHVCVSQCPGRASRACHDLGC